MARMLRYSFLCTYDLYGPMRNAFDAGSIHYERASGFMYKSPRVTLKGGFRAHTNPPVRLSNITALLPQPSPPIHNLREINRKL